jgi:hypothetical protein
MDRQATGNCGRCRGNQLRIATVGDLKKRAGFWWAHQDLNLEPTDYESAALTN